MLFLGKFPQLFLLIVRIIFVIVFDKAGKFFKVLFGLLILPHVQYLAEFCLKLIHSLEEISPSEHRLLKIESPGEELELISYLDISLHLLLVLCNLVLVKVMLRHLYLCLFFIIFAWLDHIH